jgi:hypothetical protein
MADNSKDLTNQRNAQLKIVNELLKKGDALTKQEEKQLKIEEQKLSVLEKRIEKNKLNLKVAQTERKETESFLKSYTKLNGKIQQQLAGQASSGATYLGIGRQLAKEKAREVRYEEATTKFGKQQKQNIQDRLSILGDVNDDLLSQAKATQLAEDKLSGTTELQRQLRDLDAQKGSLTKEQYELAKDGIMQTDRLRQKEERLNMLAEERKSVFESLPGPIQNMVNGAEKFGKALMNGALPMVLLASLAIAVLTSFTKLDESAKGFRETTGLTNSQMEGIKSQANDITGEFAAMGVDAEKVFNTVAGLKSEFSDIANFSDEVVAGLTLLNTNFGVSAESAAKVQGIFEQIGGLSSETAAGVQLQVANMAKLAGVAPAKVFEDIAENAEIASTLFQGDVESLTKAAIEARRLGTNLKSVASTTEHLLDFQSNIGDELVAATFVGGQFNLTQARSLAAAGKTVEAQKEVLRQLQRGGDFREKDYFTQQQLAKAAGMSVEEINKQLNAQEKLNSLNSEQRALADKAIAQGLDISNINKDQLASQVDQFSKQQEMQGQVEKLNNAFMGISATIGSSLTPLLEGLMPILQFLLLPVQAIATGFGMVVGFLRENIPLLVTLGALAGVFYAKAIAGAVAQIWGKIVGFLGPFGIPVAIAASIGAISMAKNAMSTADDMYSPPGYGSRVLTGPEGSIALNNNDTVLAGTNLGGGGDNGKMDALIAAVKETKDIYMDGRRVTQGVGRVVGKSQKNSYGFV